MVNAVGSRFRDFVASCIVTKRTKDTGLRCMSTCALKFHTSKSSHVSHDLDDRAESCRSRELRYLADLDRRLVTIACNAPFREPSADSRFLAMARVEKKIWLGINDPDFSV